MVNIIFLILILTIGFFFPKLALKISSDGNATFALGMLMLTGFLTGNIVKRIKFPAITGHILVGILIGPFVLKIISLKDVQNLQLLNSLALSIIALTAGGEIKISELKKSIKTINSILLFQTIIVISGIIGSLLIINLFYPVIDGANFGTVLAFGILLGIVSTASSPSTTLAVIVESRKKNYYTDLILSIVMIKDVVILLLFALGLSFADTFINNSLFNPSVMFKPLLQILGAILVGLTIGLLIVLYLRFVKKNSIIFILAVSFFSYEIFEPLHLHPLLIMMIAGFIVENFSKRGDVLLENLESISPPVYIIFFTLTGAAININYLKSLWVITLGIVLLRLLYIYLGTMIGGMLIGQDNVVKKKMWMSFISQAGLSLGMAKIIELSFGETGSKISVIIISVIIVNQIIGPLLLKLFLDKNYERKEI